LHVFDEAILLGDALLSYDAGHGRGPCRTRLLDEEFEGPETAAAGRDLEQPSLGPLPRPRAAARSALHETTASDVLCGRSMT